MPAGVHGTGPGIPSASRPMLTRVHAVDVLVRVDLEQRRLVVDVRRRRVLEEDRVDGAVVVEVADRREHVGLGGVVAAGGCAAR